MNKRTEYIKLCNDIKNCHLCKYMNTKPHSTNGEYLTNDSHGLQTEKPYVNLWNLWNGNLDADIMVIGQDFGTIEDIEKLQNEWKTGKHDDHTDKYLKLLFDKVFSIDVDSVNAPLFFTNMANCYRHNKSTGDIHSGWLPICANKFMGRLIKIIRPKIIIVLGQKAFEAMFCLDNLPIICIPNLNAASSNRFESIMSGDYMIKLNDINIDVFPVYHPGANSQRNRKWDQQILDWQRIKACYDTK